MSYTKTTLRVSLQLLVIVQSVIPSAGQSNDAALVEQFFPGNLVTEAEVDFADGGPTPSRNPPLSRRTWMVQGAQTIWSRRTPTGSPVLFGSSKSRTTLRPSLPAVTAIDGRDCAERVLDQSRCRPASGSRGEFQFSHRRMGDWIFKWGSGALSLFGPFIIDEDGDLATVLHEAGFVDLTGDGIPEIVNPPERTFTDNPATVMNSRRHVFADHDAVLPHAGVRAPDGHPRDGNRNIFRAGPLDAARIDYQQWEFDRWESRQQRGHYFERCPRRRCESVQPAGSDFADTHHSQ